MKFTHKLFVCLFILYMYTTTSYAGESISTRGGSVSIINKDMSDGRKNDVLLFNNKEIYNNHDAIGDSHINFEKQYNQSGKDVLIFGTNDNGLRCDGLYLFLTIYPNKKYKISKGVGNCNGPPVYSTVNNKIIITLPVSSTREYVVTYDDGNIKKINTKKNISDKLDSNAKECFYAAYASGCKEYPSFVELKAVRYLASNACLDNITYYIRNPSFNISGFGRLCRNVSKSGKVVDSGTFDRVVFRK